MSTIKWIRYDGTPETLPRVGERVLLYRTINYRSERLKDDDYKHVITHYTGEPYHCWYSEDRNPVDSDYWAYLPAPEVDENAQA